MSGSRHPTNCKCQNCRSKPRTMKFETVLEAVHWAIHEGRIQPKHCSLCIPGVTDVARITTTSTKIT